MRLRIEVASVLAPIAVASAVACSPEVSTLAGCEADDGITPICGFVNPEDIALVASTPWIIVSEFPPAGRAGALVARSARSAKAPAARRSPESAARATVVKLRIRCARRRRYARPGSP